MMLLRITSVGPVFVRMSDVGPVAAGFWRIALAAPVLVAAAFATGWRPTGIGRGVWWAIGLGGLCFAGDLASWHIGILKTQLANDFSLDSQNQDGFCDNAQSMFEQAAEHRGQSLSGLMDALNFDGATPFDQCSVREAAVSRDTDDGMVEGGSSGAVSRTAR